MTGSATTAGLSDTSREIVLRAAAEERRQLRTMIATPATSRCICRFLVVFVVVVIKL